MASGISVPMEGMEDTIIPSVSRGGCLGTEEPRAWHDSVHPWSTGRPEAQEQSMHSRLSPWGEAVIGKAVLLGRESGQRIESRRPASRDKACDHPRDAGHDQQDDQRSDRDREHEPPPS